jgi:hypothetical protein
VRGSVWSYLHANNQQIATVSARGHQTRHDTCDHCYYTWDSSGCSRSQIKYLLVHEKAPTTQCEQAAVPAAAGR